MDPKTRLEELRLRLRAQDISYGELAELQGLADYIEPGDVELAEPAGIPEEEFAKRTHARAAVMGAASTEQRKVISEMEDSGHIVFLDC